MSLRCFRIVSMMDLKLESAFTANLFCFNWGVFPVAFNMIITVKQKIKGNKQLVKDLSFFLKKLKTFFYQPFSSFFSAIVWCCCCWCLVRELVVNNQKQNKNFPYLDRNSFFESQNHFRGFFFTICSTIVRDYQQKRKTQQTFIFWFLFLPRKKKKK